MFRQIKSAIIWSYIWRFRSLLAKILIAILIVAVLEFVYGDVVEYLRLSDNVEYLWIALLSKWILILLILFYVGYSIWKIGGSKDKKSPQKTDNEGKMRMKPKSLSKKEIRELAQKIIEQKAKRG